MQLENGQTGSWEIKWRQQANALIEPLTERLGHSGRLVGNSVENHLLQGEVREFYAGAPLAGVIWTL